MSAPAPSGASPLERVLGMVRRVIGVPDYDAYLVHVAECHPGTRPLTKDEFLKDRLDAKYSRPGQRCC